MNAGAKATHAAWSRSRSKYRAVRTNGYASKLEARVAARLHALKASGVINVLLEQVPIKFASGVKFVCDFMAIYDGGRVEFVEAKGVETAAFKIKMRLLEAERPEIFARLTLVKK